MVKVKKELNSPNLKKITDKIMTQRSHKVKRKTTFFNYPVKKQILCDFLHMIHSTGTHVTITPTSVVVTDKGRDHHQDRIHVPMELYSSTTAKFLQTHILPHIDGIHFRCLTDLPKLFSIFSSKIWRALTYSFYASSVINQRDGIEEIDKIKMHMTLNDSDIVLEKFLPFYKGVETDITKQFTTIYRDLQNINRKSFDEITLLSKIQFSIEPVTVPKEPSQRYHTDSWVHQQEAYSIKYSVERCILSDFVNLSESNDQCPLNDQELFTHLLETNIGLKSKLFVIP